MFSFCVLFKDYYPLENAANFFSKSIRLYILCIYQQSGIGSSIWYIFVPVCDILGVNTC